MTWRFVLSQVFRGHSAGRALMHLKVRREVEARGTVLDIGGGSRQTYLTFVDMSRARDFITIDIGFSRSSSVTHPRVRGSVTSLPLRSDSVDTILCFNLLEHVYDHRQALAEIRRVMSCDAVLYGWVPFILGIHGAPQDYWRDTDEALGRLLSDSGFTSSRVENTGTTFLSAYDLVRPYCRFWFIGRLLRVVLVSLALMTSWALSRIAKKTGLPDPEGSPTGVWFMVKRT